MTLPTISAATQVGFPLLSVIIFLPVIAALLVLAMKDTRAIAIGIVTASITLALTAFAWITHDTSTAAMQLTESIGFLGIGYSLGIDGISAMFLPATALLTLFAVLCASKSVERNVKGYMAALLLSEAALLGAFAATDLSLFWIFFVAEIIPSYFLIKGWGTGSEKDGVARNYLMYMTLSALAIGIGFILLAINVVDGISFDLAVIAAQEIDPTMQTLIFFVLCVGFAIKAPLFPLHSWLPKVLEHGPLVGMSVFLVGIKLGAYCFIRFVIPLLPEATAEWFWLMAVFGVLSMVYGAMIALVQTNLRRLMAFASVSHMGVVMLGFFSLNISGIEGGLLQAINLGITGAGLFLIASFLSVRISSPDLSAMGGLQSRAPYLALGFLVIALSAIGMPGTSGFNGEHMVLLGAFERHWLMAICVGIGPILAAAYFLKFYQRAFLGDAPEKKTKDVGDLDGSERFIVVALVAVVFWIGLFTTPFISTMRSSVEMIASEFNEIKADHAQDVKQTGAIRISSWESK